MFFIDSDKVLIESLTNKRLLTESFPISYRKDELFKWGIHFSDLFRDINDTISFSINESYVFVHIAEDVYLKGKPISDGTLSYNVTMDYQIKVLQRIRLLEWLDKERYIIWVDSGIRSANYLFEEKRFSLINEVDKQFIINHFNYDAVAAKELSLFVKNKYKTTEELRYEKTRKQTWIAIGVTAFVGIASILLGIFK